MKRSTLAPILIAALTLGSVGCAAQTTVPSEQSPFAARSDVVAFPGLDDGRPTVAVGSLYVATRTSHVYAYAPGATMPKLTITRGIDAPVDLFFDGDGDLFVGNAGSGSRPSSVTVYARGKGAPVRTITDGVSGLTNQSIAVAKDGTLIVGDMGGISEYRQGATTPFLKTSNSSGWVVLASQTTFDATQSAAGAVSNFTIGQATPNFTITNGLMAAGSLAVDSTRTLYVDNACGPGCTVTEYGPHGRLLRTLSNGIDGPEQVVIDCRDNLLVVNLGEFNSSLSQFHRMQTSPYLTVTRGLVSPVAAAIDGAGTVYVANEASRPNVLEYARNTTVPIRTIVIPNGELPSAIVVAPPGV